MDKMYDDIMSGCLFCDIINGKIPAYVISSSDYSIAFLDVNPLALGHTLVIPKKHYEKIQDLDVNSCTDLFALAQKVVKKIDTLTGSTLFAIHNGKISGQEVPHVHIHLIPRSPNDGAGPIHSMFKSIEKKDLSLVHKQLKD
ncbi:MAG: HIT family protein [Candidatus Nitrosoabyssus spongiisocia]|nr:MAG: HIT family protein [Nitrosopumilaceae archaeon AB1(1)]